MVSLLLAHKDSLESHIERIAPVVDARVQEFAARTLQTDLGGGAVRESAIQAGSSWGSWWDGIVSRNEGGEFERHGRVALIKVHGPLSYRFNIWSWIYNASCYIGITNRINAAVADTGIDKIVLHVDSPGGSIQGALEAANAVYSARESKEVVAVVDPTAASAGYWLASQATRIVGLESGWSGSVGAQWEYVSMSRMLKEHGYDVEVLRSAVSPDKNSAHPYEPIKEKAKAEMQAMADHVGEQFVEHVARGRALTVEKVKSDFGGGQMFFTPEAIRRRMVDAIGSVAGELASEVDSKQGRSSSGRASALLHGERLDCRIPRDSYL